MITLASMDNENNDIHVDSYGNIATFVDAEALANVVYNVDKTNKGECPLDTSLGIDYFNTVFASPPNLKLFRTQNILETEKLDEVIAVDEFSFNYDSENNILKYTKIIDSIYGEVAVNG